MRRQKCSPRADRHTQSDYWGHLSGFQDFFPSTCHQGWAQYVNENNNSVYYVFTYMPVALSKTLLLDDDWLTSSRCINFLQNFIIALLWHKHQSHIYVAFGGVKCFIQFYWGTIHCPWRVHTGYAIRCYFSVHCPLSICFQECVFIFR